MNKDLFEILVKNSLENHKASVPDGAWQAISSKISGTAVSGPGISSLNFGLGLVAGSTVLISLGVYSEFKEEPVYSIQENAVVETLDSSSQNTEKSLPENTTSYSDASQYVPTDEVNSNWEPLQSSESENAINSEPAAASSSETAESKDEYLEDQSESSSSQLVPMSTIDSSKLADNGTVDPSNRILVDKSKEPDFKVQDDSFSAIIEASDLEGYAPMTVSFSNVNGASESVWFSEGKLDESGPIAETTFDEPGIYRVYLTAYDDNGRKAEDVVEIVVKEGSDIQMPNIFTPNGDGLNDTYKVGYAKNIEDFYIRISDATGTVVYESTDINAEWVFDNTQGAGNLTYEAYYQAVGVDGKIYKDKFPLIIVVD